VSFFCCSSFKWTRGYLREDTPGARSRWDRWRTTLRIRAFCGRAETEPRQITASWSLRRRRASTDRFLPSLRSSNNRRRWCLKDACPSKVAAWCPRSLNVAPTSRIRDFARTQSMQMLLLPDKNDAQVRSFHP